MNNINHNSASIRRNRARARAQSAVTLALLSAASITAQSYGNLVGIFPTGNPDPAGITAIGDDTSRRDFVFSAVDANGRELWYSDGSAAATPLTNLNPLGDSVARDPNAASVRRSGVEFVYFQAQTGNGVNRLYEWNRSTNVIAPAFAMPDIMVDPRRMAADFLDRIYFTGIDNATGLSGLWVLPSNGATPVRLQDAAGQLLGADLPYATESGGYPVTLFNGLDSVWGQELWVSFTTGAGPVTRRVTTLTTGNLTVGPSDHQVVGDRHVFIIQDTNGITVYGGSISSYVAATPTGPSAVPSNLGRIVNPTELMTCGDAVYAIGRDPLNQQHLFRYTPVTQGAMSSVMPTSNASSLTVSGDDLFFRSQVSGSQRLFVAFDCGSSASAVATAAALSNVNNIRSCGTFGVLFTANDAANVSGLYFSNGNLTRRIGNDDGQAEITRSGTTLMWSAANGTARRAYTAGLLSTGDALLEPFGTGSFATMGPPVLAPASSAIPEPGGVIHVRVTHGAPISGAPVYFAAPTLPINISTTQPCELWVSPFLFDVPTDANGEVAFAIPLDPALSGLELYLQAAVSDPIGTCAPGVAVTNPVHVMLRSNIL